MTRAAPEGEGEKRAAVGREGQKPLARHASARGTPRRAARMGERPWARPGQ